MPKYRAEYNLEFRGEFIIEADNSDDALEQAGEELYDCWHNMVDRPYSQEIIRIEGV